MKISVITVTYNDLPGLRRTLSSVIHQDYADFEYIVVDGASTDGTRAFLEHEASGIDRWVSEPDSGIYEAMNKGVRLATGDYCIFMNAGDSFIHDRVLSRVESQLDGTDIVLGNEILVNEQERMCGFTPAKGSFTLQHLLSASICHQATFIKKDLLLEYPYDESLRLVSDWKFILERFIQGRCSFKTINIDICFFRSGGRTDTLQIIGKSEKESVLLSYSNLFDKIPSKSQRSIIKRIIDHSRLILRRVIYTLR